MHETSKHAPTHQDPKPPVPHQPRPPPQLHAPRVLSSTDLLDGRCELIISHRGAAYRLRLTAQDKLILTK